MPRVTKRQKESGHPAAKKAVAGAKPGAKAAGGKPYGRPGGKPSGQGGPDAKPGHKRPVGGGFKVGPSHAPRDAYLGKG